MKERECILIFEPHPDDVTFQIAGSVYKWMSQGKDVHICTVTTGNRSTFDIDTTSEDIKRIMAKEHAGAMEILGIAPDRFTQWDYDDLGLDCGRDRLRLLEDMVKLIRKVRPATVVTMDPRNQFDEENPDHRLVASVGFDAAAMAANPNVMREQFDDPEVSRHFVARVLFYMSPQPDVFIDIAGAPIDKKIELGLVYDSQLNLMMMEGEGRLAALGVESPIFSMPKDVVWPQVCNAIAADIATECVKMYPNRKNVVLAEAFRLQYLGIVHKLKDMLPEDAALM